MNNKLIIPDDNRISSTFKISFEEFETGLNKAMQRTKLSFFEVGYWLYYANDRNKCFDWVIANPTRNPDTCGCYKEEDERLQPKKVNLIYSDYKGEGACGYCPNCGKGVIIKNTFVYNHRIKNGHFCEWCGQSLDWGKEPFRNIGSFKSLLLTIKENIKQDPFTAFLIIIIIIHIILIAISVFT